MKRYALLLSYAGEVGEDNYCRGVAQDIANYDSFLITGVGGYWKTSEIEKLDRPSVSQVREKIRSFATYDYVLTIFAGHGFHSTTSNSTVLDLNQRESIDSAELRKGAPRQTLILDCCRVKSPTVATEMRDSLMKMAKEVRVNPMECRKYYDRRIEECAPGIVVMNACSINETAGDDALRGGYYSSSLLEASAKWSRNTTVDLNTSLEIRTVVAVHNDAEPLVHRKSGDRQHPTIEKPRTDKFFPFCILA